MNSPRKSHQNLHSLEAEVTQLRGLLETQLGIIHRLSNRLRRVELKAAAMQSLPAQSAYPEDSDE